MKNPDPQTWFTVFASLATAGLLLLTAAFVGAALWL